MKMLVTGAGGMLGQALMETALNCKINATGLTHEEMDICNQDSIRHAFNIYTPEIVVNCAGIVKGRDFDRETYYWVNSEGPKLLETICNEYNIKMVQISTDCVFKGLKACSEIDLPDALDVYGESKRMGEISLNHLTLRMSFIGFGERGLVSWLMKQRGSVDGYRNVQWNGLTTHYAALNIVIAILKGLTGIVHICGQDTTKYDVLCYLNEALGLELEVNPVSEPITDRRLITIYDHDFIAPPIEQQIEEMVNDYCCDPCRP